MKKLIVTTILLATGFNTSASTTNTTRVKQESKAKIYTESQLKFQPKVTLESGVSDNPLQLPEKDLDSSFLTVQPSLEMNFEILKNKLLLYSELKGELKKHNDDIVDEIKEKISGELSLGLTHFVTPDHELGFSSVYKIEDSGAFNFTAQGLSEQARDVKYNQIFVEPYYSFNQDDFYFEVSGNYSEKTHDSFVQDDVLSAGGSFAEFKDDYRQVGARFKLNYHLSNVTDIYIEPSYTKRDYKERSARHTEGTTNQGVNPVLSELYRGMTLGFKSEDKLKTVLKLTYAQEKDLIFKANNANLFGLQAELGLPVFGVFELLGKYSWSQREFDNFVTNPQQNPTSRDFRKDLDSSFQISAKKEIGLFNLELKYNEIDKDSNYKPFGSEIGSVYSENIFSLNISATL